MKKLHVLLLCSIISCATTSLWGAEEPSSLSKQLVQEYAEKIKSCQNPIERLLAGTHDLLQSAMANHVENDECYLGYQGDLNALVIDSDEIQRRANQSLAKEAVNTESELGKLLTSYHLLLQCRQLNLSQNESNET